MNILDFTYLANLLKQRSGLVVSAQKGYLLESRLLPIARDLGLDSLEALVAKMRQSNDEKLLVAITEAMTTNESFFFRDNKPFTIFRDETLPTLLRTRADTKQIRIWCAAASTGQEPYSLAMILKDAAAKLAGWRIEILGTDISSEVLRKAEDGIYSQFEVQRGLPIRMMVKYFSQVNETWQIAPEIRAMVKYRQLNLLDDIGHLGRFDVIYCRNVLIYFDQETKSDLLERLSGMLRPDGVLFLGGAETVLGVSDKFKPVEGLRGVYAQAA